MSMQAAGIAYHRNVLSWLCLDMRKNFQEATSEGVWDIYTFIFAKPAACSLRQGTLSEKKSELRGAGVRS